MLADWDYSGPLPDQSKSLPSPQSTVSPSLHRLSLRLIYALGYLAVPFRWAARCVNKAAYNSGRSGIILMGAPICGDYHLPNTYDLPDVSMFDECFCDERGRCSGGSRKCTFLLCTRGNFECQPLDQLVKQLRDFFFKTISEREHDPDAYNQRLENLPALPSLFDTALSSEG